MGSQESRGSQIAGKGGSHVIRVGTSGFQFKDWRGPFYPEGLPEPEMLGFYSRRFAAVELNFTYYRMPGQWAVAGLAGKTPDGFEISVKVHRSMTHEPAADEGELRESCRR